MVAIQFLVVSPFFTLMDEAQNILCSGDKDFVFTTNQATAMITASPSRLQSTEWMDSELSVLQLVRPDINRHLIESGNWKLDATALEAIDRSTTLAVLPNASDSLSGINYDHMAYLNILSLSSGGVADASGTMPCLDGAQAAESAVALHLSHLLQNDSITFRDFDNLWLTENCWHKDMSSLRAICPQLCGCHQFDSPFLGFFGSPRFGRPHACSTLMKSNSEFDLSLGHYDYCTIDDPPVLGRYIHAGLRPCQWHCCR